LASCCSASTDRPCCSYRGATPEQTGAILATLAISVHKIASPPDVLSLRDTMAGSSRLSGGILPKHIAAGILTLIERLSPGDGLCHGDLHPGNVIMTADGPRLIDWGGATRAPGGLDLACCHVIHCWPTPETVNDPERPRAYNAVMHSEYARLAGMSSEALTAAIEPYLPIARVRILLGPAGSSALRERLIHLVEATLRSED
jgi:streptomycin 6-kinase